MKKFPLPLFLTCALGVPFIPAPLPAQNAPQNDLQVSNDEPIVLSAFEVRSEKDSGYRVGNSVATTGIAQDLAKTPLPITVVTDEFMKDANLEGFLGALSYVSAVSLDPNAADGNNPPGLSVGNSQLNENRFRGQPINGTFRNGMKLQFGFYTENVDRIEVAKGPMAVFVGGSTLGGEVNLVTKKPVFSPVNNVEIRVGSHDSFKFALDSSGAIDRKKTLAYRLITSYDDRNTWRDFSHSQIKYIDSQLLWRPSDRLSTRIDYQFRDATGNLVSQNTASTENYQSAFDDPSQALLDLGKRRTGALAGKPYTVAEYRTRIAQSFGNWRQDMYDTTGRWVSLGEGEGLIEGNAPDGRRYNYFGPNAGFRTEVNLTESETTLIATDWLQVRFLGRYVRTNLYQKYYWYGSRVAPGGNTNLVNGNASSIRLTDETLDGKLEAVFKKEIGKFGGTLLLGGQNGNDERTQTQGQWNYSALAPVQGSPNVPTAYGAPAVLTGSNIFMYFDLATQAFPDTSLVQHFADDVLAPGVASRSYSKTDTRAGYAASGLHYGPVWLTGGFRRDGNYTASATEDSLGQVVLLNGVPQRGTRDWVFTNSWMYGAVVEVTKGVNLYGSYNYGETYQPGALVGNAYGSPPVIISQAEQLANPKPNATGTGKEIGVKVDIFEHKLTASFGWFDLVRGGVMVTDAGRTALDPRNVGTEVDPDPATTNPAVRYRVGWLMPVQGNETAGYETDWVWTPTPNYSVVLGASHLIKNKQTVDKPDSTNPTVLLSYLVLNGRPLENSPNDTFRVFQRYLFTTGPLAGFSTGLGVRYQSPEMPSAYDTSWGLVFPGFYVADLTFGYKTKIHRRPTEFLLGITNMTNHTYFEGNRLYGAPREFSFTTRFSF